MQPLLRATILSSVWTEDTSMLASMFTSAMSFTIIAMRSPWLECRRCFRTVCRSSKNNTSYWEIARVKLKMHISIHPIVPLTSCLASSQETRKNWTKDKKVNIFRVVWKNVRENQNHNHEREITITLTPWCYTNLPETGSGVVLDGGETATSSLGSDLAARATLTASIGPAPCCGVGCWVASDMARGTAVVGCDGGMDDVNVDG